MASSLLKTPPKYVNRVHVLNQLAIGNTIKKIADDSETYNVPAQKPKYSYINEPEACLRITFSNETKRQIYLSAGDIQAFDTGIRSTLYHGSYTVQRFDNDTVVQDNLKVDLNWMNVKSFPLTMPQLLGLKNEIQNINNVDLKTWATRIDELKNEMTKYTVSLIYVNPVTQNMHILLHNLSSSQLIFNPGQFIGTCYVLHKTDDNRHEQRNKAHVVSTVDDPLELLDGSVPQGVVKEPFQSLTSTIEAAAAAAAAATADFANLLPCDEVQIIEPRDDVSQ